MECGGEEKGRTDADSGNNLADFGRQRAQTEQPAAGRVVWAGGSGVVGVMVHTRPFDAMIDHIGMGQTVGRVLAVAEGQRRRRHDEAKSRQRRKDDRELKAKAGPEPGQHDLKANSYPPAISQRTGQKPLTQALGQSPISIAALER
jgi:hypothetical protein